MSKVVQGIYPTIPDALAAIDTLKELGLHNEAITVVASETFHDSFPHCIDTGTVLNSDEMFNQLGGSPSIWNKLKDYILPDPEYTLDDYIADSLEDLLYPYKEELSAGNIAILVNREAHETKPKNY